MATEVKRNSLKCWDGCDHCAAIEAEKISKRKTREYRPCTLHGIKTYEDCIICDSATHKKEGPVMHMSKPMKTGWEDF